MIDPHQWREVATKRRPKLPFVTEWYDGTTQPTRPGYYERHFTDSEHIGCWSMQYWDGRVWRSRERAPAHWLQVGDYPAWRGLTAAQAKLNGQKVD